MICMFDSLPGAQPLLIDEPLGVQGVGQQVLLLGHRAAAGLLVRLVRL